VINRHRKVVYTMRRKILEGDIIEPEIQRLIKESVNALTVLPSRNNLKFVEEFQTIFPLSDKKVKEIGEIKSDIDRNKKARAAVQKLFEDKEEELTSEVLRGVEREVYLQVLDTLWMQHLENMQHLREGIHWRSVGQRDPLVEYRSESQKLFDSLQETLREEVLRAVFHVRRSDTIAQNADETEYDTELTRLAENSVESGVNEVTGGEMSRDSDFGNSRKVDSAADQNKKRNDARKRKKAQRQNRKKGR